MKSSDIELLGDVVVYFDSGALLGIWSSRGAIALYEEGIKPKQICCASVGALIGPKCAEKNDLQSARETREVFDDIETKGAHVIFSGFFRMAVNLLTSSYLHDDRGVARVMETLDLEKIVHSPVEVLFVVRNETSGKEFRIFSTHEPRFKNNLKLLKGALFGAVRIPGGFPAGEFDGDIISDGFTFAPIIEEMENTTCHTAFIFLNDCPYGGKDVKDMHWERRLTRGIRSLISYTNILAIKRFLDRRKDFYVFDYGLERRDHPVYKEVLEYSQNLERRGIPPTRRLVIISPREYIKTLSSSNFKGPKYSGKKLIRQGDLTVRGDEAERRTKEVMELLIEHIKTKEAH